MGLKNIDSVWSEYILANRQHRAGSVESPEQSSTCDDPRSEPLRGIAQNRRYAVPELNINMILLIYIDYFIT